MKKIVIFIQITFWQPHYLVFMCVNGKEFNIPDNMPVPPHIEHGLDKETTTLSARDCMLINSGVYLAFDNKALSLCL